MDINTREIAAFIWIFCFILYLGIKNKDSTNPLNLLGVLKSFCNKHVLTVYGAAVVWACIGVLFFSVLGVWEANNAKTTIFWFLGFAFVTLLKVPNDSVDERDYFNAYLKSLFQLAAVVAFIAEAYTFSIFWELVIFPILAVMVGLKAVSERKPEHRQVVKVVDFFLIVFVFVFISYSLFKVIQKPSDFFSWAKFSGLFLPLLLSLWFIPFVMVLRAYIGYEKAFLRIGFWLKDKKLLRYAKRKSVMAFGTNIEALDFWRLDLEYKKSNIRNEADVDASIAYAINYKIKEKIRGAVPRELGWNPYDAKKFLNSHGLRCSHYKVNYMGWGAESNPCQEGLGCLSSITYFVSGNENYVHRLQLKLFSWGGDKPDVSDDKFFNLCFKLAAIAAPEVYEAVVEKIVNLDDTQLTLDNWHIALKREDYRNGDQFGYERFFDIKVKGY